MELLIGKLQQRLLVEAKDKTMERQSGFPRPPESSILRRFAESKQCIDPVHAGLLLSAATVSNDYGPQA